MLRFYKGAISIDDVRAMTPERFGSWVDEMNKIMELENPEAKKEGLSGNALISAAMNDPAVRKIK